MIVDGVRAFVPTIMAVIGFAGAALAAVWRALPAHSADS